MEQLPRKPSAVALIVESDLLRRHEMAARLRRGGFEVFEAADAAEAITVLKSIVVDILISNVDLRGRMDGIDLARRVRQCYVDTSVVLTSEAQRLPRAVALGYVQLAAGASKHPHQSLQFSGGAMDTLACIGVLDFNNPAASSAYSVDGVHAQPAAADEPRHR